MLSDYNYKDAGVRYLLPGGIPCRGLLRLLPYKLLDSFLFLFLFLPTSLLLQDLRRDLVVRQRVIGVPSCIVLGVRLCIVSRSLSMHRDIAVSVRDFLSRTNKLTSWPLSFSPYITTVSSESPPSSDAVKGKWLGSGLALETPAGYAYILSGALVGLGTYLSSGCTSGHMLCGLARLSKRSLVSTALCFAAAVVAANLVGGERAGLPVVCEGRSLRGCFVPERVEDK